MPVVVAPHDNSRRRLVKKKRLLRRKKKRTVKKKRLVRRKQAPALTPPPANGGSGRTDAPADTAARGTAKDGHGFVVHGGGAAAGGVTAEQEAVVVQHLDALIAQRSVTHCISTTAKPRRFLNVTLGTQDYGVLRSVQVNEFLTGRHVLRAFADKLRLEEWEHFQLALVCSDADPMALQMAHQLALDHGDTPPRIPVVWLDESRSLLDQDVTIEDGQLVQIRVKLYAHHVVRECTCVRAVQLFYTDMATQFLSGHWHVDDRRLALRLGSFVVHVSQGSHSHKHKPDGRALAESLQRYLPASLLLAEGASDPSHKRACRRLARELEAYWWQYRGMRRTVAQVNFCELITAAPAYGSTHTAMRLDGDGEDGGGEDGDGEDGAGAVRVVAVVPEGVQLRTGVRGTVVATHTFAGDLVSWDTDDEHTTLTLHLKDGTPVRLSVIDEPERDVSVLVPLHHAADMLEGYRDQWVLGSVEGTVARASESARRRTHFEVAVCASGGEYEHLLMVDAGTTAGRLMRDYCAVENISDHRLFGLCESTDDTDRWLDPDKAVIDQFVTARTVLTFKLRYHLITPAFLNHRLKDARALFFYFVQYKHMVVAGYWVVAEEEAVRLAAISVAVEYGTYDPALHKQAMIFEHGIRKLIPRWLRPAKKDGAWASLIMHHFRRLEEDPDRSMERRYVDACIDLPTFGMTYFKVEDGDGTQSLLGVHQRGLAVFEPRHWHTLHTWSYRDLRVSRSVDRVVIDVFMRPTVSDDPLAPPPEDAYWEQWQWWCETPLECHALVSLVEVYHNIAYARAQHKLRRP